MRAFIYKLFVFPSLTLSLYVFAAHHRNGRERDAAATGSRDHRCGRSLPWWRSGALPVRWAVPPSVRRVWPVHQRLILPLPY